MTPAHPPLARTIATVIAFAGLVLLVADCSSALAPSGVVTIPSPSAASTAEHAASPTPTTTGRVPQALAYAQCMRAHGVPDWPDPDSSGSFPKDQLEHLAEDDAQLLTGQAACQDMLPNGGVGAPTEAQLARAWLDLARFASCMRSHGVMQFPDPTASPQHPERPTFDLGAAGIDPNAPRIRGAISTCRPQLQDAGDLRNLGLGSP
jgi:hypothetical protein